MSHRESSHERLCQIVEEQERRLTDLQAEVEQIKNKWLAAEESAAASFREMLQYRTYAEKAAAEIERLTTERDTLRHDAGVYREKIALLEATVRTYERQMGGNNEMPVV